MGRNFQNVLGAALVVLLLAAAFAYSYFDGNIPVPPGRYLLYAAGWLGTAALTAWLARQKRRPVALWCFLGLTLGPIALLAVGLAPAADRPTPIK